VGFFFGQFLGPTELSANKDDAFRILKGMSDYLADQKTISVAFDASIEVITPDLEKIQFNSSGQVLLARPDRVHASRVGGYADVELIFDGKKVTILGKNINAYTQFDAPGTTDQMYDRLRTEYSIQMPGADLLMSNAFEVLTEDVEVAKYIGAGVIGSKECEHLAFRNEDSDWQLWVQTGPNPFPCKMVITSKTVTGFPQYTLVIRDWKSDQVPAPDAFAFKAPEGAKLVKIEDLSNLDEVPPGVTNGEKQ
jgi:hypothetical protein